MSYRCRSTWVRPAALLVAFAACAGAMGQAAAGLPPSSDTGLPLGSVAAADADVQKGQQGALRLAGGRTELIGSAIVTARDHTAAVALARGGEVRVCRTSSLHLAASAPSVPGAERNLLLALDRGALEIQTRPAPGDAILTPDLRMTLASTGELDLRLRVTPNGDTCVENRGRKSPFLRLDDAFGDASYIVKPGQHMLFEHGSLREVVDRETTPCGCPPDDRKPVPLAEALLHNNDARVTPAQVAAANPFPTAQSEGLAQPAPVEPDKAGSTHVQVSTTLQYDPTAADAALSQSLAPATSAPARRERKPGPLHGVGRFFKRIFVR